MNRLAIVLLTIFLSANALSADAQVRQTFRVLDFSSGKPVGGAHSELYGTKLTTDANGIATAVLAGDKKGAFLPIRDWQREGYRFFGAAENSMYKYLQTKDTITHYIINKEEYYNNLDRLTDSIFSFWYRNSYLEGNRPLIDSALYFGINGARFANVLYGNCFIDNNMAEKCASNAKEIYNPMFLKVFNSEYPEIVGRLFAGDINGAVSEAGRRINQNGIADINPTLSDLYRYLRYLDFQSDTLRLSDITKSLYEKRLDNPTMVKYLYDLNKDKRYGLSDSLSAIWKKSNNNPLLSVYFTPGLAESFDKQDKNTIKTLSDDMLSVAMNNCLKYPCEESEEILLLSYMNSAYASIIINDSAQAVKMVDTVANFIPKISKSIEDNVERSRFLIEKYNTCSQFFEYATEETRGRIVEDYIKALETVYNDNRNSVANQLMTSECGYNILRFVEDETLIGKALDLVYDANKRLCKRFPVMFSVRNMQVASQMLGKAVTAGESPESIKSAFGKYTESFDIVEAVLPYCYVNNYLDFNSTIDGYLAYNQNFTLNDEIATFTDRLLIRKAEANNSSFYVEKAKFLNATAEKLYSSELFDESIAYYLQSNEMYEKILNGNDSLWTHYLTNLLQMGDAHLNLNQFDKAIMTYGRIYDFENQVPKARAAEYSFMKGSAHYYTGDAYKSQNNMKMAEKEYRSAEKEYNRAIALGSLDANATMGEMYFGKAVAAAQEANMKRCIDLVNKSVRYYEASGLERPYRTYEKAKTARKDFAKESGNIATYRKDLADLSAYYKKFLPLNSNYAGAIYDVSNEMLGVEGLDQATGLQCAEDMAEALIVLHDQGYDVDRHYFRTMHILADAYLGSDSVRKAILTYRDAYNINTIIYKDTAMMQWEYNSAVIYENLADCYEKMAEVTDTARRELWYYRATDTRDTAISILELLAKDGDESVTYRIATDLRDNALVFYRLDMVLSALDRYEKANELLSILYNSEYKSDVESDIIRNYTEKGLIHAENNDKEKAVANLRTALEYARKAERPTGFSLFAAIKLAEILGEDKEANSAEISKLNKYIKDSRKSIK